MWCDNSKFNKMDDNKVDEITRLAMNIYSNKGVYALLLGSGISLSAGILSGWKVTEDLLKKLAAESAGTSSCRDRQLAMGLFRTVGRGQEE